MTTDWHVSAVDQVEITYKWEAWEVEASWPQKVRRDITTNLRVRYLGSDPPRLVLSTTRINLLSTSAKTAVSRMMCKVDEPGTDQFVHRFCDNLIGWYKQAGHATQPEPAQRKGDSHLLYPIWPVTGETLIGAATNSFKSIIAEAIAVQATTGADILSGNTRPPAEPFPVLYCDWEAGPEAFSERLYAILKGAGLPLEPCVSYLGKLTTPLTDVADGIAEEIRRNRYQGVIIDSLSAAIGGSLIDDELANQFWNAAARLGVPCIVLAHKSAEAIRKNHQRAFGSVMHENRPRMYWDARREPKSPLVAWEIVSDNITGRQGKQLAWRIDITNEGDYQHRRLDTITFTSVNPDDVTQAPDEGDSLTTRIERTIIENGPLTSGEIATVLGYQPNSIRNQLSRHKTTFNKLDDTRWELAK